MLVCVHRILQYQYAIRLDNHLNVISPCVTPFRSLIPRLPPKQLMVDSLLEERRRGLQRWLRIIAKHPVLRADVLFLTFLTDSGADHHDRLRQAAVRQPDEFAMLNENVTLPLEDQGRLAESRETMRTMLGAVTKLKRLADQQAARAHAQSKDVAEMSAVMRLAGSTATNDSNSNADSNGGGGGSGGVFAEMASGFAEVAELSERCALHQHNSISERFNWLTDILVSHSDLCDRVERGIVSDHQKAMSKMLTLNKQRMKGVIQGTAVKLIWICQIRTKSHACNLIDRRRKAWQRCTRRRSSRRASSAHLADAAPSVCNVSCRRPHWCRRPSKRCPR